MEVCRFSYLTSPQIPIFRPSFQEFSNFEDYISKIENVGAKVGIVKIIPPKEWIQILPDYSSCIGSALSAKDVKDPVISELLSKITISNSISQSFNSSHGSGKYLQVNIETEKTYDLWKFKKKALQFEYSPTTSNRSRFLQYQTERFNNYCQNFFESITFDEKIEQCSYFDDPNTRNWEILEQMEYVYWNSLRISTPTYGADLSGTLFPSNIDCWNISRLPGLLNNLDLPQIPGVNTPFLYFGMWKATFAWHVEDADLFSINYLHFGKPKQWYIIPPAYAKRFEEFASNQFPEENNSCPQFLRHKVFHFDPEYVSANAEIPVYRMVQWENEIIITFPYGYHAGFNYGFNCAESINFAMPSWIPLGKIAKKCSCSSDVVDINVSHYFSNEENDDFTNSLSEPIESVKKKYIRKCVVCKQKAKEKVFLSENGFPVHYSCAFLIPGIYVDTKVLKCNIQNIDPHYYDDLICFKCRSTEGACITCCSPLCTKAFHPSCFLRMKGLTIDSVEEGLQLRKTLIYCKKHELTAKIT